MGARESTAQAPRDAAEAGPPDYYALLEVDEDATADEIKVCDFARKMGYTRH